MNILFNIINSMKFLCSVVPKSQSSYFKDCGSYSILTLNKWFTFSSIFMLGEEITITQVTSEVMQHSSRMALNISCSFEMSNCL